MIKIPKFDIGTTVGTELASIALHAVRLDDVLYYHPVLMFLSDPEENKWVSIHTTIFERCRTCATALAVQAAEFFVTGVTDEVRVYDDNMKIIEKFSIQNPPPHLETYLDQSQTGDPTIH